MLTGTGTGQIYLFSGRVGGKFADHKILQDKNGKPLNFGDEVGAAVGDWDADGDCDLVVGTRFGQVLLVENKGTAGRFAFAAPRPLFVESSPLFFLTHSAPAPAIADWDHDGDADLLVGTSDGRVLYYENAGTARQPMLSTAVCLVDSRRVRIDTESKATGASWGTFARLCVTDFNGDGRLDLLVGDHHNVAGDAPPSAERKAALERERSQLRSEWARLFRAFRKSESQDEMSALRAKMLMCKKLIAVAEKQLGCSGSHGYVWLLIRS